VTVATSSLLVRFFVSCGVLFLVAFIVVCMFAYVWCLLRVEQDPFMGAKDQKVMTRSKV